MASSRISHDDRQNTSINLETSLIDTSRPLDERHEDGGSSSSSPQGSVPDIIFSMRRSEQPSKGVLFDQERPTTATTDDLPGFLHCNLDRISTNDVAYLKTKGCFNLPSRPVMDELLKCYFEFIHPHLPMLDEQEFWETYLAGGSELPHFHHADGYSISLLLFQAMIFAATTCASMSTLKQAGYKSRLAARRAMFSKVRILYSLDVEQDKMILLQCLLLMSYWRDDSDNDKDAWHWSGLAVSLALTLRLQTDLPTVSSERQKTFRKRCWWSCVVRDRLVALSENRCPRISLDECDLPMLTLADYNVGLRSKLSDLSPGEELGKRTALSMFFIQLTRLIVYIDNERSVCTPGSPQSHKETWARSRLLTDELSTRPSLASLDYWKTNLPEVLQHSTGNEGDDNVLPCIIVHRIALHIYYQ